MNFMINVTESALKKIVESRNEEGLSDKHMLRIFINVGGCSGFNYKMDFTDIVNENDKVMECDDVRVVIDNKSYLYLLGMTLDYEGGLNGAGFKFINPNATQTCSCGSSFNV